MAALSDNPSDAPLLGTPLRELHVALGARMAPFAGYDMPVQYPSGIIAEHLHTRAHAGLFDVSHMGQAILAGPNAAAALERLVPGDLRDLRQGRARYTLLLNGEGNILDDLIVTRLSPTAHHAERFFLVVNAGNKAADWAHLRGNLPDLQLSPFEDRALIAVQGPEAAAVLGRRFPQVVGMPFMSVIVVDEAQGPWFISRCGYTGEDGFEISLPASESIAFAEALLSEPQVRPIGLGARDSLRLEAGLCLHGHDIDATTNPVEADLAWSISPRRRLEGGFPGSDRIRLQLDHGPPRRRVGIAIEGRQPAREGVEITTPAGLPLGHITSGGFGPTLGAPIAMGYVAADHASVGTPLMVHVRGKALSARVAALPFVPHRYHRSSTSRPIQAKSIA